jgi:hypothetical protein
MLCLKFFVRQPFFSVGTFLIVFSLLVFVPYIYKNTMLSGFHIGSKTNPPPSPQRYFPPPVIHQIYTSYPFLFFCPFCIYFTFLTSIFSSSFVVSSFFFTFSSFSLPFFIFFPQMTLADIPPPPWRAIF